VEYGASMPFVASMEEINDRSLEDHGRSLKEISLYFSAHCTFGQLLCFSFVISYQDFLVLFCPYYLGAFLVYTSYVRGSAFCF
jgi:hypothetical protein